MPDDGRGPLPRGRERAPIGHDAPTPTREREIAIDALRGFALLGIALVNVPWIGLRESLPSMLATTATREAMSPLDLGAAVAIEALCEGRFYPIFSTLFGLGAGMLVARDGAAYARRIAALFAFGLLHATFGWYGDVLLNYAFAGVIIGVLAWRVTSVRVLIALTAVFLVATQALSWTFDGWLTATDGEASAEHLAYVERELRVYRDGSFASISEHRFREMLSYFSPYNLSYRMNVLTCATLGLAVERSGLLRDLRPARRAIGRVSIAMVIVGAFLAGATFALPAFYVVAGDVMGAGYVLAFLWLALSDGARWPRAFAALGRMALTGYLFQTLCFTLFFYGYGLAMYGALGPAAGALVSLAVFASSLVLANLWLSRFEIGPMEWLWRAITYGRAPRLRRA